MSFNKIPLIGNEHSEETRNILNLMVQIINNRGVEILSDSAFLTWLDENGIKHQEEVSTFADLPENDSLNTVRGVSDDNKIYIKKENGWVPFQSIDLSKINDLENKMDEVQVYARDFGVVADGVTDDSASLQNAINAAAGRPIILPDAKINVASRITYSGELNLKGSGSTTEIDLSKGGDLRFVKDLANIPDLSTNIIKGTSAVDFVSAHNLSEGDVFIVYNPTEYSWSKFRSYYHDGCMFKVDRVINDTQVKIFGVSPDTYIAGEMKNFKTQGQGINLENFKIIPNPESTLQVMIDGHHKVNINNVTIPRGSLYTGIEVHRCYEVNVNILNAEVVNGDAYPISISNTQKVTVSQSALYSARHAIALGGRSGVGCVPTRDVLIDQCILMNRSDNGIGAADMHGNCENVKYTNCILNTGANMAGKNVKYENCTIYGRDPISYPDGNCVFGSEVLGGSYEIVNCRFVTEGNGRSFGLIDFGASRIEEDLDISIKNCKVQNKSGFENEMRFVKISLGEENNNPHRIDIEINGIRFSAGIQLCLSLSGAADISKNATVIVDNIYAPGELALMGSANLINNSMPMRMQRQSGKMKLETDTTLSYLNSLGHRFKYAYPKEPIVNVSTNLERNVAQNHGGIDVLGDVTRVTTNIMMANIHTASGGKWTTVEPVDVMWTAGIDEI